jgi:hypothetical protein
MRIFILLLLISQGALGASRSEIDKLPAKSSNHKTYIQMRNALGFIESRNDPAARNSKTSASGKYQFLKAWDKWFLRNAGKSWTINVPAKKAGKAVKDQASLIQDQLFDRYYDYLVSPWLQAIRKRNGATNLTDPELVALYHRQGEKHAQRYLLTGQDKYAGKYGNRHVSSHIKSMNKAMRFEHYIETMEVK